MWLYIILYVTARTDKGSIYEIGSVHISREGAMQYAKRNARGREIQLVTRPLLKD